MAETEKMSGIRTFGTVIRTEMAALALGLVSGVYVWWGWFSEWATYDPDWRVKTDSFTRFFRGSHPFPDFNGDPAWSVSLMGGLLSELGFILIVTAFLYVGRLIKQAKMPWRAGGIWISVVLAVAFLCVASDKGLPFLSIPFLVGGTILVIMVSFSEFDAGPSAAVLEGFFTVPFFCGLASLIGLKVYAYYFNEFRPAGEPAANPLPAVLAALCMALIYAAPAAIQVHRWRRYRLPWASVRDYARQALLLPPVVFAVSSAAMIAFIFLQPEYHRHGNAAWINLFFYIQTSCVSMMVVFFVFRLGGYERSMRRAATTSPPVPPTDPDTS